jgi:hypothetical protein
VKNWSFKGKTYGERSGASLCCYLGSIMQTQEEQQEAIKPPSYPGEWSLRQIQEVITRPLPDSMLKSRSQGGKEITYIPWFSVNMILDKYAPGWSWDISRLETTSERIFLVGRLSIPTADGVVSRDATGTEQLDTKFSDPSSKAESMAFRRASARFGLGLHLYQ